MSTLKASSPEGPVAHISLPLGYVGVFPGGWPSPCASSRDPLAGCPIPPSFGGVGFSLRVFQSSQSSIRKKTQPGPFFLASPCVPQYTSVHKDSPHGAPCPHRPV